MSTEEPWVGIEDVAAHLQVAKDKVYRWVCLRIESVGCSVSGSRKWTSGFKIPVLAHQTADSLTNLSRTRRTIRTMADDLLSAQRMDRRIALARRCGQSNLSY